MNKEEYDKYKKIVDNLDGYDICDEFNLGTYELKDKKKLLEIVLIHYFKNQDEIEQKDKEIERLNNIINELEKYYYENIENCINGMDMLNSNSNEAKRLTTRFVVYNENLVKLKELKEGK